MSLRVDDSRHGRSRSKSATRERSRSRSNVRAPSPPSTSSYGYPAQTVTSPAAATPGAYGNGVTSPTCEVRSPTSAGAERSTYFPPTSAASTQYPPPPPANAPYPSNGGYDSSWTMGDYKDLPPHERPGYVPPTAQYPSAPQGSNDGLAYGGVTSPSTSRQASYSGAYPPPPPQQNPYSPQTPGGSSQPDYRYTPGANDSRSSSYNWQYAQPPEKITYTAKPQTGGQPPLHYNQSPQNARPDLQYRNTMPGQFPEQLPRTYQQSAYGRNAQVVDITPGYDKSDRKHSTSKSDRLSLDTRNSTGHLTGRMNSLSVGGPDHSAYGPGSGPPPASPLLEAYHGTYQQISPMPLALRPNDDDDLDDLPPLSPTMSRTGQKPDKLALEAHKGRDKKRVVLYDPEEDAKKISEALGHRTKVDTEAICDVLPGLSHDNVMELRKEYKKQVKVQGKGVNLSKHLKTKLTGNLGKVAYVVALGKWESEGYWANFWYQSHSSRRELLIESLMGRTNADIWNIKDEFRDKRYADSLVKCMEKELKMDKFRTAVLMALEERRQEEQDVYPVEYRNRDVEELHKALTAKSGGESAMLQIIVLRSDAHLREIIRTYDRMYQENLPRAALKRSSNLVGEVIAHILNGVINKPARDALLLHHAIQDIADKNKDDDIRYELLISRLVRLHWDKMHLERVKREYYQKYKKQLEEDLEEATRGDFMEFMCELCQTGVRT